MGHRYIGPFSIIAEVGKVAYSLDQVDELSQIHNTFDVSQLQKSLVDGSALVTLDDIEMNERLNYIVRDRLRFLTGRRRPCTTRWWA